MSSKTSSPITPLTREDVSEALSTDWFRVSRQVGKGALADATGAKCTDTIDNAITGKCVPELHRALNSLLADPTALFSVLSLYGGCFVPVASAQGSDMATISGMLKAATEYLDRMKDGSRCHQDTLALAELFTPLIPSMLAIVREAGNIKASS